MAEVSCSDCGRRRSLRVGDCQDTGSCIEFLKVRIAELEAERNWFAGWLLRHKYALPPGARDEALRRATVALDTHRAGKAAT